MSSSEVPLLSSYGCEELAEGTILIQESARWRDVRSTYYWLGLTISLSSAFFGYIVLNLLLKLYFINGGSRIWLSACAQASGWPISALAAGLLFWKNGLKFSTPISSPKVFSAFALLGWLDAFDGFLYDLGVSYLPASTTGILFSSQLAFIAGFTILLLGHKVTAFSWNAVVLVISSAVILALDSENDKLPQIVTINQQILGYIVIIAAAAIYGLIKPLTALVFDKLLKERSFQLNPLLVIFEFQAYIGLISTGISMVAMGINHDFGAMHVEAHTFVGGETAYYGTLLLTALSAQMALVGIIGTIYLGSALLAGVIVTTHIPIGAMFYAVYFHESFGGFKVMSVLIAVWGSSSYVYGGYLDYKKSQDKY